MERKVIKLCMDTFKVNQRIYRFNRRRIIRNYLSDFILLEGFCDFSNEIYRIIEKSINNSEFYLQNDIKFAILRIQEKSIKVFCQAQILMENGSASGALARWRTLYELSVIAAIIDKYPFLAERFIAYATVEDYKYLKNLMIYKDRLTLSKIDSENCCQIESEWESLKEIYGWTALNRYEWANEVIDNPSLFGLASIVKMEHLYTYVEEAHLYNNLCMRRLLIDRKQSFHDNEEMSSVRSKFVDIEMPMRLLMQSLHTINLLAVKNIKDISGISNELMNIYTEKSEWFVNSLGANKDKKIKIKSSEKFNNKT